MSRPAVRGGRKQERFLPYILSAITRAALSFDKKNVREKKHENIKVANKRNNSIKALNELNKRNLLIVVESAAVVLQIFPSHSLALPAQKALKLQSLFRKETGQVQ